MICDDNTLRDNNLDILYLYSSLSLFREIKICPYSSLDIQYPTLYLYLNTQIGYTNMDTILIPILIVQHS